LLAALQHTRKLFDAVQSFALWQRGPVDKAFQQIAAFCIAVLVSFNADAAASWR
jgi:hypothetical protein